MILAIYILLLAALILHAPDQVLQPGAREFVVLLGVIGAWRYGWGFVHFVRSWYYRRFVFSAYRKHLQRLQAPKQAPSDDGDDPDAIGDVEPNRVIVGPSQLFIIVTSYRIEAETTALAFRSIFDEATRSGLDITVVASVVETADQRFVKRIFRTCAPSPKVSLMFVKLAGAGKREALAVALNAVSRRRAAPDAAVAVMDGDSILSEGAINAVVPFLAVLPEVGGITTDEDSVISGGWLMGIWHRLRFAQRQVLMSSMALSGRVLAMTGRFSVYRASIATNPDFIDAVRNDALDHWRLGRLKLLTGEDKSTWLWLLKNRWRMLYVPDIRIWTVEHPPSDNFFTASTMLMNRWFGNMLRTSGRAIALGPGRCGWFTWWCLIDQRLSMWTPLIGPTAVLLASAFYSLWILYAYLIWIMFTRLIQTLMLLSVRNTISGLYPVLLYFSQIYGAMIKTYVLFRPDRQRWTRQDIVGQAPDRPRIFAIESNLLHGFALTCLTVFIAFWLGILQFPEADSLSRLF